MFAKVDLHKCLHRTEIAEQAHDMTFATQVRTKTGQKIEYFVWHIPESFQIEIRKVTNGLSGATEVMKYWFVVSIKVNKTQI